MEAKLLEARLKVAKQESMLKLAELQASGVDLAELGLDPKMLVSSYDDAINQIGANVVAKTTALAAETGAEVAEENLRSALKTDEAQRKALEAATQGNTTADRITSLSAEGGFESLEGTREKIAAVQSLITPMTDQLKSLGPEGELVAAVVQGSMIMADSFVAMSDNIKETMKTYEFTAEENALLEEINELKKKHNAVILAHNYQMPQVQLAGDFLGDSYELSKKAAATDAEMIVFCGV